MGHLLGGENATNGKFDDAGYCGISTDCKKKNRAQMSVVKGAWCWGEEM